MERHEIDSSQTVAQVLGQWPASAAVFVRRGMACVGCSMAPFETLFEVASVYGQELPVLLAELVASQADGPSDRSVDAQERPRSKRPGRR
jgi:hybrid cluster-associated redox disulfide protein